MAKKIYSIYLAHPISGLSYEDVMNYYNRVSHVELVRGFNLLSPMTGKDYLSKENNLHPKGYDHPESTPNAIVGRDSWMVEQADIVYVDFCGATKVSIGCCMELAWAHQLNKHTIVSMEDNNVHQHAFVTVCADIIFKTHFEAINYLNALSGAYDNF